MKILSLLLLLLTISCADTAGVKNKNLVVSKMADGVTVKYPTIETIEADELMTRMQNKSNDLLVVDVRSLLEMSISMIPGAMPKELFEKTKDAHKDKLIVTYCTIGGRSSKYSSNLQAEGFKTKSLKGGVLSWAHAKGEFVLEGEKTNKVQFLNKAWDLLPEGYEGVTP